MKLSTLTSRSLNSNILVHCCSWLLLLFMMAFSTSLKAQMIPYAQLNATAQTTSAVKTNPYDAKFNPYAVVNLVAAFDGYRNDDYCLNCNDEILIKPGNDNLLDTIYPCLPPEIEDNDPIDICKSLKVLIIIDKSGSIQGSKSQVEEGVLAFIDGLVCPEVLTAVMDFSSKAEWIQKSYKSTGATRTKMESYFNSFSPFGNTNWNHAFYLAQEIETPDLVLFFTDGNPTNWGLGEQYETWYPFDDCDDGSTTQNPEIFNAMIEANILKKNGAHIFGLGVGTVEVDKLKKVTGDVPFDPNDNSHTIANTDYFLGSFSELAANLADLVGRICPDISCEMDTPACKDTDNGSIKVHVTVSGSYTYTVKKGGSTVKTGTGTGDVDNNFTINGLAPGDYEVSVIIPNGACPVTRTCNTTITYLQCSITSQTNVTCHEGTDGSLTIVGNGGTGSYEYSIDNGVSWQPSGTFSGLTAKEYDVQVRETDGNACVSTCTVTITQPLALTCEITADGILTCSNESVQLNLSTNAVGATYSWTGPNFTSDVKNPSVSVEGKYTVNITDKNGCTTSCDVTVEQDIATPDCKAGGTQHLTCTNPDVELQGDSDTEGATFAWTTDDGNIKEGANSATPTVDKAGTYILTVTGPNGCTSECQVIVTEDKAPPECSIDPAATLSCDNPQTTLNGASVTPDVTYSWSTTDGNIVSGDDTATPVVSQPGTYTLTVTSTINGCFTTCTVVVPGNSDAPSCKPTGGVLTCNMTSITLDVTTDAADPAFSWTGPGTFTSTDKNPVVSQPGNYVVEITDGETGCTSTCTALVTQNINTPSCTAIGGEITCNSSSVTLNVNTNASEAMYSWTGPGTFTSSVKNPVVTQSGTYKVIVTDGSTGCTTNCETEVTEDLTPPNCNAGADQILTCDVTEITLEGSSTTTDANFNWSTTDGNIKSGKYTKNPVVDAPGTYTLTVTAPNGCTSTCYVDVTGSTVKPTCEATGGLLTCDVSYVDLDVETNVTNVTYSWVLDGDVVSTDKNPRVTMAGTYYVTVTNLDNGCTSTCDAVVGQNAELPSCDITGPTVINCNTEGGQVTLTVTTDASSPAYSWTATGGGNIVSGNGTANIVVDEGGNYEVTITDGESGCESKCNADVQKDVTLPSCDITGPSIINCNTQGGQVTLTATTNAKNPIYSWTATNGGNIVSGGGSASIVVNAGGNYEVTITDGESGCESKCDADVVKDVTTPTCDITGPGVIYCNTEGGQVTLTATTNASSPTYSWTAKDGGNIVSGGSTASIVVNEGGNYEVTITDSESGCETKCDADVQKDVAVPTCNITGPMVIYCNTEGGQVTLTATTNASSPTYSWTAKDGGNIVSGGSTASIVVNEGGNYEVTITDSESGCETKCDADVEKDVTTPTCDISGPTVINCNTEGGQVTLTATTNAKNPTFSWTSTVGGNIVSGGNTLSILVDAGGNYEVTITDGVSGCETKCDADVQKDVAVPTCSITGPMVIYCNTEGGQVSLTATTNASSPTYSWTTTDGNIVSGGNTVSIIVNEGGNYEVTITDGDSGCETKCAADVQKDVVVPTCNITGPTVINCNTQGGQVTLAVTTNAKNPTFSWTTTGGNIVSGGSTASIVVDEGGNYEVTITDGVSGCETKCDADVQKDVAVPTCDITGPAVIYCNTQGGQITLTATTNASNPTYSWTTTGGNIVSGGSTASIVVDEDGNYEVTITDGVSGCVSKCDADVEKDVALPTCDITGPAVIYCNTQGGQITLTATTDASNPTYSWTTTGGNIVSGGSTASILVDEGGNYEVTITDGVSGCETKCAADVEKDVALPTCDITGPAVIYCNTQGGQITLTATTNASNPTYSWTTTGGNIVSGGSTASIVVDEGGNYEVTITDGVSGCVSKCDADVEKDVALPTCDITGPSVINCNTKGGQITLTATTDAKSPSFSWTATGGGNIVSGGNTASIVVNEGGNYEVTITDGMTGCESKCDADVEKDVTLPSCSISGPAVINCNTQGGQVTLMATTDASSPTFIWTTTDGNIVSGDGTASIVVDEGGNYEVTIRDGDNGCESKCDYDVEKDVKIPTCEISGATVINCYTQGGQVTLTVTTDASSPTFSWNVTGGGNIVSGDGTASIIVDAGGNYEVMITDGTNGCASTCSADVTEDLAQPDCNAGSDKVISCPATDVTLEGSSTTANVSFSWSTTDGNITGGGNTATPTVDQTGTYTLTVTAPNGCISICATDVVKNITISCNDAGVFECSDEAGIQEWLKGSAFTLDGDCFGLHVENNLKEIENCGVYQVIFTIVNEQGVPYLDDQGQAMTCTNMLTIQDTKAPVIVVAGLKEIDCSEATVFDEPEIYDNCDDNVEVEVKTDWYVNGFSDCRHRRIWTATDNCGNTTTATQIIQVIDLTPPELVAVHPLLVGLADGDSIFVECSKPAFFTPAAFEVKDDCTKCPQNYTVNMDDYAIFHNCEDGKALKEIVCWWYVTDKYDRTVRYTIHIFMMDRMPPEFISVPEDKTIACDAPIEFGKVVTFDACSKNVSLSHRDTLGISALGQSTITRIWKATDGCGNWDTASQTITLERSGPVFTSLPEDKVLPAGSDVVFDAPVASSECGEVTIEVDGEDEVNGDQCEGLTYTRTWKAVSDNGLSGTASQTITLKSDQEAPVFNRMPGDVILPCGSELPTFNIGVTDNVDDGVTISSSTTAEGEGCDQVVTRTWTATDACGNTSTVSQEIRFSAHLDITFTYVPGHFNGKIGATVPDDQAIATSECTEGAVSIAVEDKAVQDSTCERTIHRLFIATDGCDNRDTAIQVITMIDDVSPVVVNTIRGKSIACGDSILFDQPEFTDNVGIESIVTTDSVVQEQCSGYHKRTWKAIDSCGNFTEISQKITILPDTKAPVFTSSDSIVQISCNDTIPSFTPEATDNCSSSVSMVMEETTSGDHCDQRTVRLWTATDSCGNSSTLKWEIIRRDTLPPQFDHIPQDFSVTCMEDVVFDTLTVEDDCSDSVQLNYMDLKREGNCFTGFEVTRTWMAMDKCGNMNQAVQNIFVMGDTLAPMITSVPNDTTILCGDPIPEQTVEVSENCRIDTVMVRQDYRPLGDGQCDDSTGYFLVRSWIAVDQCGNRDTASQYIAVLGEGQINLIAFIEVPGTKVVSCADDATFDWPVVKSTCDSVSITSEDFTLGEPCAAGYKMIREWTAADTCGQSVSTYQTIIIRQDTTAPQLSMEFPVKFMRCGSEMEALSFDEPTVWDACTTELVSSSDTTIHDNSDADSIMIRTWTYADQCGNESSISQKLIFGLNDTEDYFRAEQDTFNLSCVTEMELHQPVVYSCDTVAVSHEDVISDSTCMNQLTVVRTWTAVDTSGNEDSYVQLFNINDTIPPVIELASDTLYMTSLEYATNGAESNIVSIADNCGSATDEVSITKQEQNGGVWYEYGVIMSDECGNMSTGCFVVIIAEKPPIVNLQYTSPDVVAQVSGGVLPFDYSWSYLRPGSHSWTPVEVKDKKLNLSDMGLIRKVKVLVTDAQNQLSEDQLDLMVTKNVRRNITLHPNPATDYVEVRMEMEDVSRIELYNVLGQRVKFYEFDPMQDQSRIQLDIRDVPQGTYTVRFINDHMVYTRPLIKVQ